MTKLNGLQFLQVTYRPYQSGWNQLLKKVKLREPTKRCEYLISSQKNLESIKKPLFKNSKKSVLGEAQNTIFTQSSKQSFSKVQPEQFQSKQQEKNSFYQMPNKKFTLNPTQSLHSHIMRTRSIDSFIELYSKHKEHFNPRLLSIASRSLCSLCEKEKSAKFSLQTSKTLQPFLKDIFGLKVSQTNEEIKKQQLKNLLYFTKKSLNELQNIFGLNAENISTFNQQIYQKAQQFRSQLIKIYLSQDFDFTHYEVNELIEIYYELIRLSAQNENPRIYHALLKSKEKIEETVNPQFLFSTGNFLLTVKTIQMEEFSDKNHSKSTLNKSEKLFSREKHVVSKNHYQQQQQQIKHLREQCYKLFLKKWLYYYDDMTQFIKFDDLKHSWPLIVQSYTGVKLLLQEDNGVVALKIIMRILDVHKKKIEQLFMTNPRILGNNAILLQLLFKRYHQNALISSIKSECFQQINNLQTVEKSKIKLRKKTFLQTLKKEKIITSEEQKEVLDTMSQI